MIPGAAPGVSNGPKSTGYPDTRWTVPTGWITSEWGAKGYETGSATQPLQFTPDDGVLYDRFYVYLVCNPGGGTATITATGGTAVTSNLNTTAQIRRVTVSCPESRAATVSIANSVQVWVLGVEGWHSTQRRLRIGNLGICEFTASAWAAPGSIPAISPLSMVAATTPHAVILSLGLNDAAAQVSPAAFKASMQTIITAVSAYADVILWIPLPSGGSPPVPLYVTAGVASYVAKFKELATENNLLLVDTYARMGSTFQAAALDADQYHPNDNGYGAIAAAIKDALLLPDLSTRPVATATALATARTIGITGDLAYTSPGFDGSANVTAAATLATTGVTATTYGGTSAIPVITVDAKGRITSASNATPTYYARATVKTTTYSAAAGDVLDLDTAGGAFTVTLPASPSAGDIITLYGTKYNWPTNNLTIGRNGATIDGTAADIVIRKAYLRVQLIYSGLTWNTFFSSPQVDIQIFTASGTWYKPARAYSYEVILIGGGGGGGSGRTDGAGTDRYGGGGGSGAGIVLGRGMASLLSATESVTVGAGGAGGNVRTGIGNGNSGTVGGFSLFGPYQALGGNFGGGGQAALGAPGAASTLRSGSFPVFATSLSAGGAGSNSAGTAASTSSAAALPTGGGGGAGLNTSNTQAAGGVGGTMGLTGGIMTPAFTGGTAGASGGGTGGNGSATPYWAGTGGGGGGSSSALNSGAGGNGSSFGAGGGGGAAAYDTLYSGAGGNGAPGFVMVTTHCTI
jgi:lysophospholipase L1-like esterase